MRSFRGSAALRASILILALGHALASWAGGPELRALAESRVGRYVLFETTEGERILQLVFGQEMPGWHRELFFDRLRGTARLRDFSTELELRLARIEERFRFNRESPLLGDRPITRLTAADRSLLSELASEELTIEAGEIASRARIRFAEPPAESTYIRTRATFEGPPLADAFPADAWEGRLHERIARLARKWPRNVRVVEDVRFRFPVESGSGERLGSRSVVVIVKGNLGDEAWRRLSADYVRAVARGTVSFPIGESPGHLYTRIGDKSYDFMGSVDMSVYYSSEGGRLEPIVSLTAAEEARLRTYVRNATDDPGRVLGSFDSGEGAASGSTGGRLGSNRPRRGGEEHNCTSWIACAPVGTDGRSLFELAGARASDVVHTNPGWWTVYLSAAPRARRVPYVIYWAEESTLTVALERVRPGQVLVWNFNPH
jgi:hypothetical protein